jgi:hypothetical protein
MPYPSIISALTNPNASDKLSTPSHSSIESSQNTAITEIETFVGTVSSAVGTLVYDIRSANSNGGGHVQTTNKGGTGQTAYAKGDLLIASSASVLSKLSVGSDGQALVADSAQSSGVKWGAAGGWSVQEATFSVSLSSATNLFSITGLDGDTDLVYHLIVIGGTTGGNQGTLQIDFNAAGSNWQYAIFGNRSGSTAYSNIAVGTATAPAYLMGTGGQSETYDSFVIDIMIKGSKTTGNTKRQYVGKLKFGSSGIYDISGEWSDTTNNLVSIQVKASASGTQTVAGKYWLYKVG